MKLECRLDKGFVCVYSIAYPIGSTAEIHPDFIFLGFGVIAFVGGEEYKDNTPLAFYRLYPKKRYK